MDVIKCTLGNLGEFTFTLLKYAFRSWNLENTKTRWVGPDSTHVPSFRYSSTMRFIHINEYEYMNNYAQYIILHTRIRIQ